MRKFTRGTAIIATASLALALSATVASASPSVTPADTFLRASTAHISGRTITLWLNLNNEQWHAEISGAQPGDRIHLDFNPSLGLPIDYDVISNTVPAGATLQNTSDTSAVIARACGFVGRSSNCTAWRP